MTRILLPIIALLALAAAPAQAAETTRTFYSNGIDVMPFTGEQDYTALPANGRQAPDEPGWITSIKVDVVKKRSASAKALSIQDVMIHHIVLHAPGAVWAEEDGVGCFGQFFAMGEENQEMPKVGDYGIRNATAAGKAPNWFLTHMLMNHRSYDFKVFVRTKVTYSDTPKTELRPLWLDTENCNPDPVYTVAGGGKKGSNHRDVYDWTVPEDGRIIGAQGHLHGGGKYQSLTNESCGGREVLRSQAYYGHPDHIFYRVRPILHEPSPISMSRTITPTGIPVNGGDKLKLTAVYDRHLPHTRVMSIMMGFFLPGPVDGCEAAPDDVVTQDVPKSSRRPYPPSTVPLMAPPTGAFKPFRSAIGVGDYFFSQRRIVVKAGQKVTWRFNGSKAHDVSVANGPRAFSSDWLRDGQEYEFTPKVKGTYGLFCTLHPGLMSQEMKVE